MVGETATRELLGEFPNQIIRASAGTGKTFALSNRYLQLLASGAECQTILATTFTRKGAGEILDRIVGRLSDAALDDAAAARLSDELDWKLSRERAAEVLHELLRNLHRLEISTLDSFFNRVAKAFSLELGLPPSWDIVEEQQMNRLNDQAIQAVLRNDSVLSLLHMLSKGEAARRVATLIHDTVDIAYGVFRESGPEPWDQLPMTGKFTPNDQLELLVERISNLELPGKALPAHWKKDVVTSAQRGDWAAFASTKSFQNMLNGINKYGNAKLKPEILEIYQLLVPHCTAYVQNRLIQQNHSTRDLLQSFGDLLEAAKSETGELRFDDVTERLQSFVSMWDTDRFSFRLDHHIQHLLLDEFQDTSLSQWNVIRPFARKVTEARDSLRSFFCVGDMKQAIFGWRGGVAEIFDLVDHELANLDETQTLTKSYRSSPEVIHLVNEVFQNVDKYECGDEVIEEAIKDWTSWFKEHSTTKTDCPGYVNVEMAAECHQSQRQIEFTRDEARNRNVLKRTISKVKELVETIPPHQTIGLIVRTNGEVSNLIFQLQLAGIQASEEGGNPITDSAAVELVLSAIQLADHPGDSISRFHVSHSPLGAALGLEPETDLNQKENEAAAVEAAATIRQHLVTDGYGPTVERLARSLMDQCTKRELLRLQQLVQIAYASPSDNDQWQLRPGRFVEYVRKDVKVSDQSSANVRVMTIHKAKGLEFDVVVFPLRLTSQGWAGMTPNVVVGRDNPTAPIKIATRYASQAVRNMLPPNFQKIFEQDRQRNVREAMCVLYVAMTRAVHATHIIVSYGAKVEHKSAAGILLATLCPTAERKEGTLYEYGDPLWFQNSAPAAAEDDPHELNKFYLGASAGLKKDCVAQEVRSGRGVPRTSPSMLEGGDELLLKSIFKTDENHQAMARGTLLHGCFQLVTWLDQATPTKPQLVEHLKTIAPTATDLDNTVASFYAMIERDNVKNMLSLETYQEMYLMHFPAGNPTMMEANRLEVENERPFAVMLEEGLLQGVIDRLVLVYEGDQLVAADVIDFKTDSISEAGLQQRVDYYHPQLAGYRRAVQRFTRLPLEKISTRLLFVETGQLVNLDLIENSSSPESVKQIPMSKRKKPTGKTNPTSARGSTQGNATPAKTPKPKFVQSERQQTLWPED